MSINNI